MPDVNSWGARVALVTGHMAGMIDQPALPVWVGILIAGYGFAPAQAGGLATLFLLGVVVSSVVLSPFFHRVPGRWIPALGFGISAAIFYLMIDMHTFAALAMGHFVSGFATGLALSFTHGTMGRTANPHRIFALGGFMLGIFAVVFLGGTPSLIAKFGPQTIFTVFAIVMAVGCAISIFLFPGASTNEDVVEDTAKVSRRAWLVIFGIMLMALNQAMIFSFLERMGADRGLDRETIQGVLIALGLIAMTPAALAAVLEKRLSAIKVGIGGALVQGLLAIAISCTTGFWPYAVGAALFPSVMLFTHTFIFGHLARIEPTGRAVAATPAMIMSGSTIAPLFGGVLVQAVGYPRSASPPSSSACSRPGSMPPRAGTRRRMPSICGNLVWLAENGFRPAIRRLATAGFGHRERGAGEIRRAMWQTRVHVRACYVVRGVIFAASLRNCPGATPNSRLKARISALSDW